MADIGPTDIWPELDGPRTGDRAQFVFWQQLSSDSKYRLTSSSSAITHWSASLSSQLGLQPYPGTSSIMALKGSKSFLLQLVTEAADSTFYYHADVWLSTDGNGNAILAASSSDEAMYFGSSSSTAIFALSTAQDSTSIFIGTQQPSSVRGVRIWEAE